MQFSRKRQLTQNKPRRNNSPRYHSGEENLNWSVLVETWSSSFVSVAFPFRVLVIGGAIFEPGWTLCLGLRKVSFKRIKSRWRTVPWFDGRLDEFLYFSVCDGYSWTLPRVCWLDSDSTCRIFCCAVYVFPWNSTNLEQRSQLTMLFQLKL